MGGRFILKAVNTFFLSQKIKQKAREIGFSNCGFAKAEHLDEEAHFLERWLNQQQHGKMTYMENWFDKRTDPRLLGVEFLGSTSTFPLKIKTTNTTTSQPIDFYTASSHRLRINENFIFGSTQMDNISGTADDSRMFFNKTKGAFRAVLM